MRGQKSGKLFPSRSYEAPGRSVSGTIVESGNESETYGYSTSSSLTNEVWTTTGTGTGGGSGATSYSYAGAGTYTYEVPGGTVEREYVKVVRIEKVE